MECRSQRGFSPNSMIHTPKRYRRRLKRREYYCHRSVFFLENDGRSFQFYQMVRHNFRSLSTGFKYHAFIIYSTNDSDFVNDVLIPTLERYNFKYCIHWKDFPVGEVFAETIVKSVYDSFKIIAVVSENFANSNPCKFELDHARHRLFTQGDDCLIVIKYDNVNVTEVLGGPLLERSYIDYTSTCDRSWWESRLVQVLQKGVLEDESDDCSEDNTNNNNLTQGNSSGTSAEELICSCQPAV